ncbi:glycoside hydrolase family 15 protein [Thermodesulfobacteriota bacterium]
MPRDIPIGNGKLLICFDKEYAIRDLYFPHVGQENHVLDEIFKMGVWIDGEFSWVNESWAVDLGYEQDTLITRVTLSLQEMGIHIVCRDGIDFHENLYVREVTVENRHSSAREVRVFFAQGFGISGNSVGDTAAYDPKTHGVVHYKGARYFLVNCSTEEDSKPSQFAVGQKKVNAMAGTYKDAEDGVLSGNAIAQGSVDSVIAVSLDIAASSQKKAYYWLAAGETWEEVRRLNGVVDRKGPEKLLDRSASYWRLWVRKETPKLWKFPPEVQELYKRSLLVLRTQADWKGGIIAANDSDVIHFNRDTYSYIWPRDGALVANAMDVAGYPVIAQRFYNFAAEVIEKEGFFLHKFNPDGTLASSWHPWLQQGKEQIPIQEDETALVLWALWNHFVIYRDIEFIKPLYLPLVKRAADFMCRYRDEETGLPLPSYDLWEERRGVLSFTVGTVFGGLTAASLFCSVFGEEERADHYRKVATEIREAASSYLWQDDIQRFCRMITRKENGDFEVDAVCDSSLWGLFAFGMYSVEDPRIVSTMATLKQTLWLGNTIGGMARYEGDYYHRVGDDFPGNPWFICTLWLADYLAEQGGNNGTLEEAVGILQWVTRHALPSGVLAEQVHPVSGEPLSVSPLTWSHATFVATCQRVLRQMAQKETCPQCGISAMAKVPGEDWVEKLFDQTCNSIHGSCKL